MLQWSVYGKHFPLFTNLGKARDDRQHYSGSFILFFLFAIKGFSHEQSCTTGWEKLANLQGRRNSGIFFHANTLISTADLKQVCQLKCSHLYLFTNGSSILFINTFLSLTLSSLRLWNSVGVLVVPVRIKWLLCLLFYIIKLYISVTYKTNLHILILNGHSHSLILFFSLVFILPLWEIGAQKEIKSVDLEINRCL